jgi:hypothetical protein
MNSSACATVHKALPGQTSVKVTLANLSIPTIPSEIGRLAIVTGTGGLGFETALALARVGTEVILTGHNADKGAAAVAAIEAAAPHGRIRFESLDLADLTSIRAFGDRMRRDYDRIDLLIPTILAILRLPHNCCRCCEEGVLPRVVNVSSIANRNATINFDDLQVERHCRR